MTKNNGMAYDGLWKTEKKEGENGDVKDGNIILSVAKAMELLQVLNRMETPASLTELSEHCGYPKSTVFGLLTTMRAYDVVTQTADGKYALGLRLFEYGSQAVRSVSISPVARPYMEHLQQQTGGTVLLSVWDGEGVLILDQIEEREQFRVASDIGIRLPAYATSQGKVFLAHMPRREAEAFLNRQTRIPFTPHTILDVPELMREIDACRTNGYAAEDGEYKVGLRSISAPIYQKEGKLRYTIGVIDLFHGIQSEEFQMTTQQVCAAADMISAVLRA